MQKMKASRKEQKTVPVPRFNASSSSKNATKPAPSKRIVKPKTDIYSRLLTLLKSRVGSLTNPSTLWQAISIQLRQKCFEKQVGT